MAGRLNDGCKGERGSWRGQHQLTLQPRSCRMEAACSGTNASNGGEKASTDLPGNGDEAVALRQHRRTGCKYDKLSYTLSQTDDSCNRHAKYMMTGIQTYDGN